MVDPSAKTMAVMLVDEKVARTVGLMADTRADLKVDTRVDAMVA